MLLEVDEASDLAGLPTDKLSLTVDKFRVAA